MNALAGLLTLLAMGLAVFGGLLLNKATAGVGVIAFACCLGIIARILQAEGHHNARKG